MSQLYDAKYQKIKQRTPYIYSKQFEVASINFKAEENMPRSILWKEFCYVCLYHSNSYLKSQELSLGRDCANVPFHVSLKNPPPKKPPDLDHATEGPCIWSPTPNPPSQNVGFKPCQNPSCIVLQLHRVEIQPISETAASATSHSNSKNFIINCDIVE